MKRMNITQPAMYRLLAIGTIVLSTLGLASCGDDDPMSSDGPSGRTIYGIDNNNTLVAFGALKPSVITRTVAVTGLGTGENIVGIDFRPNDSTGKKLYGVSSSSKIYMIDTTSGVATMVGTMVFTPAISGSYFGVDFNPVPDRIRVHSNSEQNLRLNPLTGGGLADSLLAYDASDANAGANPNLTGTAYTNSVNPPPTTTVLYAIDSDKKILVKLASPNNGKITTVGPLGVATTDLVGFDIVGADNMAYSSLSTAANGASGLYTINLSTGAATLVGTIGNSSPLRGIAVTP